MKQERESFKIIRDCKHHSVERFICKGLHTGQEWLKGPRYTFGFVLNGRLLGGLIYHDLRPETDVFLTIYTRDKRWCNRRVLRFIFNIAFEVFKVRRISLLIDTDNQPCLRLCTALGFKQEGLLRHYRENGKSCYMYGLLKEERIF